ncbi:BadF/BadG/BcrA/BcrD ATPase family protein [Celeribacter sp.]|uniref:BadF/BadG/BcrA/BcrD ATPase family protein n=1 Tax=Celeribacter sp. TaxID=1890673 RepID=UPI003A9010BD
MNDSSHHLLIAVDGGGTGCRAAIGTPARGVIARADAGRANVASDPDLAIQNVIEAIEKAAQSAGIAPDALPRATAHLGLAGVMTPHDSARVAAALPYRRVVVTDDRPTAVAGALGDQNGALLSIGTGSIIAARAAGRFRFVGSWGFHVSDQGSGAWLGRAALIQVLLCHDGIEAHSPLTRHILAQFGDDPNAIVAFSMSAKAGDYATLAPEIVAQAHAGDPWGRTIMATGATYLARGLAQVGFVPGETLCLTGGVGPHYAEYLPPELLVGLAPARGNALDGAFHLALLNATTTAETAP